MTHVEDRVVRRSESRIGRGKQGAYLGSGRASCKGPERTLEMAVAQLCHRSAVGPLA